MKNLDKLLNTRNFFNYRDFYRTMAAKPGINKIAEIGSWKGHSIIFLVNHLLKRGKKFEIYAIDIWEKAEWPNASQEFKDFELKHMYEIYNINLRKANVRQHVKDIKEFSYLAAEKFKDDYFDFVYIDGDHRKEGVRKDIVAWKPKVRKGGILAGHDYYTKGNNGVKEVVDALCEDDFLPPVIEHPGSVWSCEV